MPQARYCPICEQVTEAEVCPTDGVPTVLQEVVDAAPEADPLVGQVFAKRFRIDKVLGQGGFGTVYAATQLSMNRKAAVKTLRAELGSDKAQLKRFYHEARAASALTSPHVVRIYDFGIDDELKTPYIAMEHLHGRDLSDAIQQEAPMPPERATRILSQVAEALIESAEQGIVHRDLKPDNIFLMQRAGRDEFVKVMDFGIAKVIRADSSMQESLTGTGMTIGTPKYMSPEQALSEPLDTRSDLYSLGCILYEMLTGKLLFDAPDTLGALMMRVTDQPPDLPDPLPSGAPLQPELALLHQRLVARQRGDRPSGPQPVAVVLEAISRGEEVDAANLLSPIFGTGAAADSKTAPAFAAVPISSPKASKDPTPAFGADTEGLEALQPAFEPTLTQTPSASIPAAGTEEPAAPVAPAAPQATSETDLSAIPSPSAGPSSRLYAIAAVALFLLGGAVAAFFLFGSDEDSSDASLATASEPAAAAPAPARPEPAAPPPAAPAPAPEPEAKPEPEPAETPPETAQPVRKRPCRFVLGSAPPGAEVYRGDEYLCETPCNVEVTHSEEPVDIRVLKAGYLPKVVPILLESGRRVERAVTLEADPAAKKKAVTKARARRRARAKPRGNEKKKASPAVPSLRLKGEPEKEEKKKAVPELRL